MNLLPALIDPTPPGAQQLRLNNIASSPQPSQAAANSCTSLVGSPASGDHVTVPKSPSILPEHVGQLEYSGEQRQHGSSGSTQHNVCESTGQGKQLFRSWEDASLSDSHGEEGKGTGHSGSTGVEKSRINIQEFPQPEGNIVSSLMAPAMRRGHRETSMEGNTASESNMQEFPQPERNIVSSKLVPALNT